jgi:hypothetical protein
MQWAQANLERLKRILTRNDICSLMGVTVEEE